MSGMMLSRAMRRKPSLGSRMSAVPSQLLPTNTACWVGSAAEPLAPAAGAHGAAAASANRNAARHVRISPRPLRISLGRVIGTRSRYPAPARDAPVRMGRPLGPRRSARRVSHRADQAEHDQAVDRQREAAQQDAARARAGLEDRDQ